MCSKEVQIHMTDITLSNKEVKKMTMQEKAKEAHAHHEHLKQIALKLFEQLKRDRKSVV